MELALDDEQEALVGSFSALLDKLSTFDRVRAAEPLGFDAELWTSLVHTGVVTMAVEEASGGWGATLIDLALVAEQVGRTAASAPVVEAQVAARLLAASRSDESAATLDAVLAGRSIVTIAVRPSAASRCQLAPAGAICDAIISFDGERLLLTEVDEANRTMVSNLGSAPLADIEVRDGVVLAEGPAAREMFECAVDEWLVLTACAVVGMGAVALEQACAYAAERMAFGVPIGSFQGVSHKLADDATSLEGAQLLARKAAWSIGAAYRGRELASMAFAFGSQAADMATYNAVHVHGGYGFMLEHDVQLLYRRARGWTRVWGDAAMAMRRVAAARYGRR